MQEKYQVACAASQSQKMHFLLDQGNNLEKPGNEMSVAEWLIEARDGEDRDN